MADLTEAVEAVARAMFTETQGARGPLYDPPSWGELVPGVQQSWRASARAAVEAAARIIERQALERAAQALTDWAEEHNDGHISGPRATLRRHILMCARRITPAPTMQEIADAIMRGDYVACDLDDAGRAIAPARGYTQPAETPGQDRKDSRA